MRGFPLLPIDYASFTGVYAGGKEVLYRELDEKGETYLACEVYCDYASPTTKQLELCIRNEDCEAWSVYTLTMPDDPPAEAIDEPLAPYPQPADWFYAIHMRYDRDESYVEHTLRL